jgi:hypothetical protein
MQLISLLGAHRTPKAILYFIHPKLLFCAFCTRTRGRKIFLRPRLLQVQLGEQQIASENCSLGAYFGLAAAPRRIAAAQEKNGPRDAA